MKLKCDVCQVPEEIVLPPGTNLVRFECGNERELTREDLNSLFADYGGER